MFTKQSKALNNLMKSWRENPDSEENRRSSRENEAYAESLRHVPEQTAWFTFGQTHIHLVDGVLFDRDCVVKITSPDPRATMFEKFGQQWGMQYDEEPDMSYFPRGIFEL